MPLTLPSPEILATSAQRDATNCMCIKMDQVLFQSLLIPAASLWLNEFTHKILLLFFLADWFTSNCTRDPLVRPDICGPTIFDPPNQANFKSFTSSQNGAPCK